MVAAEIRKKGPAPLGTFTFTRLPEFSALTRVSNNHGP